MSQNDDFEYLEWRINDLTALHDTLSANGNPTDQPFIEELRVKLSDLRYQRTSLHLLSMIKETVARRV